jgi:hypothetical protein
MLQSKALPSFFSFFIMEVLLTLTKSNFVYSIAVTNFLIDGLAYFNISNINKLDSFC